MAVGGTARGGREPGAVGHPGGKGFRERLRRVGFDHLGDRGESQSSREGGEDREWKKMPDLSRSPTALKFFQKRKQRNGWPTEREGTLTEVMSLPGHGRWDSVTEEGAGLVQEQGCFPQAWS